MNNTDLEQSHNTQLLRRLLQDQPDVPEEEIEQMISRAREQIAIRDAMTFGFVHILGAFITVLATVFKQFHQTKADGNN